MPANDLYFSPEYPGFADGRCLPPRSRLFTLEPIALGTPAAEGMISYVIRLSAAYSVSPRRLIMSEFTKVSPNLENYRRHGLFFQTDARSVNGLYKHSEAFSEAVEKLCGLRSASDLTLLSLRDLLPFNGAGLLAPHPRWCPICLRERLEAQLEIYQPLAWSFDLYRWCSKHKTRMVDRCPNCGQFQHVFPKQPLIGYCCHCGTCLSKGTIGEHSGDALDEWLALAIEDIVVALPEMTMVAKRARFVSQLCRAIRKYSNGNRRRFCRETGIAEGAFQCWIVDKKKPTLPQWLAVAYCLNVGPVDFLRKNVSSYSGTHRLRSLDREIKPRAKRPMLTEPQRKAIEEELRQEALSDNSNTSVTTIAKNHHLSRTGLRYLWPDLCKTITSAYRARLATLANGEQKRKETVLRGILEQYLNCGIYPSQSTLKQALEGTGISYADPQVRRIHKQYAPGSNQPRIGL